MNFSPNMVFLNRSFDKKRLKALLLWFRLNLSEGAALEAVEILQGLGFRSATQGAISLGLDDLKTPTSKNGRVFQAQLEVALAHHEHHRGNRTPVELFQHLVDTWHRTSQDLTTEVVQLFRSTERVNPVYMMAFSGARGNLSQVRQLVGMRGLMADPRGQIVGFPILSNFREGLTITEYFVSCYGARKGVVDTAIRTADAGYLTRRLADVSHHFVVRTTNCGTHRTICLRDIKEGQKTILPLASRLVGRVLGEHIPQIAFRNQEITPDLASKLASQCTSLQVRSPLSCSLRWGVCQLCYGWGLSEGRRVTLGEAVGIIAAQSIGEPGTQLTLRTFHTGGVFSGDLLNEIRSPYNGTVFFPSPLQGLLVRTPHGQIAFLTKVSGKMILSFCRLPLNQSNLSCALHPCDPIHSVNDKKGAPERVSDASEHISSALTVVAEGELKKEHPTVSDTEDYEVDAVQSEEILTQPTEEGASAKLFSDQVQKDNTEFSLQPSTVIFVRQKEQVTANQLLAEFSSSTLQPISDQIEVTQQVLSESAGQVWFKEIEYGNRKGPGSGSLGTHFSSQKLGGVWVLAGKPRSEIILNERQHFPVNYDYASSCNNIEDVITQQSLPSFSNLRFDSLSGSCISDAHDVCHAMPSPKVGKRQPGTQYTFVAPWVQSTKVHLKRLRVFYQIKDLKEGNEKAMLHQRFCISDAEHGGVHNVYHDDHFLKYHYSLGYSQLITFLFTEKRQITVIGPEKEADQASAEISLAWWLEKERKASPGMLLAEPFFSSKEYSEGQVFWISANFIQQKRPIPTLTMHKAEGAHEKRGNPVFKKLIKTLNLTRRQYSATKRGIFSPLKQNSTVGSFTALLNCAHIINANGFSQINDTDSNSLSELAKRRLPFTRQRMANDCASSLPLRGTKSLTFHLFWQPLSLANYPNKIVCHCSSAAQKEASEYNSTSPIRFTNRRLHQRYNKVVENVPVGKSEWRFVTNFHKRKGQKSGVFVQKPIWLSIHISNNNLSRFFSSNIKDKKKKKRQIENKLEILGKRKRVEKNDSRFDQHIVHTVNIPIVSFPYIIPSTDHICTPVKFAFGNLVPNAQRAFFLIRAQYTEGVKKVQGVNDIAKVQRCQGVKVHLYTFAPKVRCVQSCIAQRINPSKGVTIFSKKQVKSAGRTYYHSKCGTPIQGELLPLIRQSFWEEKLFDKSSALIYTKGSGSICIGDTDRLFIKDVKEWIKNVARQRLSFSTRAQYVQSHSLCELERSCKEGVKKVQGVNSTGNLFKEKDLRLSDIQFAVSLPLKIISNFQGRYTSAHLALPQKNFVSFAPLTNKPKIHNSLCALKKRIIDSAPPQVQSFATAKLQRLSNINVVLSNLSCALHPCDLSSIQQKGALEKSCKKDRAHAPYTPYGVEVMLSNSQLAYQIPDLIQHELKKSCKEGYQIEDLKKMHVHGISHTCYYRLIQRIVEYPAERSSFHRWVTTRRRKLQYSSFSTSLRNGIYTRAPKVQGVGFKLKKVCAPWRSKLKVQSLAQNLTRNFYFARSFYAQSETDGKRDDNNALPIRNKVWIADKKFTSFDGATFLDWYAFPLRSWKSPLLLKDASDMVNRSSISLPLHNAPSLHPGCASSQPLSSRCTQRRFTTCNSKDVTCELCVVNNADSMHNVSDQAKRRSANVRKNSGFFIYPSTQLLQKSTRFSDILINIGETHTCFYLPNNQKRTGKFMLDGVLDVIASEKEKNIPITSRKVVESNITTTLPFSGQIPLKKRRSVGVPFLSESDQITFITNDDILLSNSQKHTTRISIWQNRSAVNRSKVGGNKTKDKGHLISPVDSMHKQMQHLFFVQSHSLCELEKSCKDSNPTASLISGVRSGNRRLETTVTPTSTYLYPGQLVTYGEKMDQKVATTESGQVLYLDSQRATLRKAQTVLIYSQAILSVLSGEWIQKSTPLMALSYQKLVTGDIVQGLPKIEQFFEAPLLKDGTFWSDSLQAKLNLFFQEHRGKFPLAEAVRKGFSDIQRVLVEGVQRVYISQGVLIADKHLEVIVRQMTCKGRILYSGDTGFLRNELVALDKIESVNQVTYGQKALYHPQVRGITDASLESESFLSAASFQETTRVLSRDAVIGKTDLMRGLKERVIVGELIQAGTGLTNNSVYSFLLD